MFSALTFNMQNGQPWNDANPDAPGCDLQGTMQFLRSCEADLIFLQEVEEGHDGGRQVEPPPNFTRLQEELADYHGIFAYPPVNPDELPFGLGLAIFCRYPLLDLERHVLPAADLTFSFGGWDRRPSERLLLAATAEFPSGPLRVLNTHLQAYFMLGTSSEVQRGQRDALEKILRQSPRPVLLGGDFNCAPGERLVEQLMGVDLRPVQQTETTWRRRPYVLDHLFYSPELRLESWEVLPTLASDHHGVRAVFQVLSAS